MAFAAFASFARPFGCFGFCAGLDFGAGEVFAFFGGGASLSVLATGCGRFCWLLGRDDIDSADANGVTALYWSVRKGHEGVMDILIGARADLDGANSGGELAPEFP